MSAPAFTLPSYAPAPPARTLSPANAPTEETRGTRKFLKPTVVKSLEEPFFGTISGFRVWVHFVRGRSSCCYCNRSSAQHTLKFKLLSNVFLMDKLKRVLGGCRLLVPPELVYVQIKTGRTSTVCIGTSFETVQIYTTEGQPVNIRSECWSFVWTAVNLPQELEITLKFLLFNSNQDTKGS